MRPPAPHPDAIADCVLQAFRALPPKYKPRTLSDGRREWVPLAGIVLSRAPSPTSTSRPHDVRLRCAALATGMKCLPQAKLGEVKGNVLHDWHAEVLAIRGFNRWLVDECSEMAKRRRAGTEEKHEWIRWREEDAGGLHRDEAINGNDTAPYEAPFSLHPNVDIHMFCTEAPCGDASMELTMAAQDDPTPWTVPPTSTVSADGETSSLPGRANFSQLGIVRRKPSRPDAPPTLSKSCSDKLALNQCTSLLSGVVSLLVDPRGCYLRTLVLPHDQIVKEAVERCFGTEGRMKGVSDKPWFKGFEVVGTERTFEFAKMADETDVQTVPSNLSAMCTIGDEGQGEGRKEVLINGVLQGRKQMDPKGSSSVCRRRMWEDAAEVLDMAGMEEIGGAICGATYEAMKASKWLVERERTKQVARKTALKGWKRNSGDEQWGLRDLV